MLWRVFLGRQQLIRLAIRRNDPPGPEFEVRDAPREEKWTATTLGVSHAGDALLELPSVEA